MKILHLSSEKTWRGGEQQIAYLIQELSKNGISSFVVARRDSAFEDYCRKNSIPYKTTGFRNELDVSTIFAIKSAAEEFGVDLVHTHTAKSHGLGVFASVAGMKAPLVVSKRTDNPVQHNIFSRFKFNTDRVKRILCVSKKIEEIVRSAIENKSKCVTVHSGTDLSKFKFEKKFFFHDLLKIPRELKLVGNASAISEHKDYFTFVDTAEKVCSRRQDVRFLIIGDGPLENEVRTYVKSKGLEDKVLFTGFLSNIPEVLFNLDVFLITSKEEGLGTTILDAHACRVPVVATRAGGIPEIVINGVSGTLCEIGDSEALAKAVEARLNDRNTFEAYQLVQKFSKAQTALNTISIYRDVLKPT